MLNVKLAHAADNYLAGGLALLEDEIGAPLQGLEITAVRDEGIPGFAVDWRDGRAQIRYAAPHLLFRALGLLAAHRGQGAASLELAQQMPFGTLGVMYDASRNSVPKVETVTLLLKKLALMGYNMLMLYTEDTYEVPGYPAFGHFRGRYGYEEMKHLDDTAHSLGIELVPCIQTLAHLERFLRWRCTENLQDTKEVLLVGEGEVYTFIGAMLDAAMAPVRSRRVHLGLDEAWGLGLGNRLWKKGYVDKTTLMREHLYTVDEMCAARGLKPMMWGDMLFRNMTPDGGYYNKDVRLPPSARGLVPSSIQSIYWDYYHNDEAFYDTYIAEHRRAGIDPIFAGGVCSFLGMVPNLPKTLRTAQASVAACKRAGIREVLVCCWKDNGGDAPPGGDLLGFLAFSEHCYGDGQGETQAALRLMAPLATGAPYEDMLRLGSLDVFSEACIQPLEPANPAKYFLWQDPLLGQFDLEAAAAGTKEKYAADAAALNASLAGGALSPVARPHMELAAALAEVLELKADFGVRLKQAYDAGDRDALARLRDEAGGELRDRVARLHAVHGRVWLHFFKPFGWEVTDIRYGGLLARLAYTTARLDAFLGGELAAIEELEQPRLGWTGLPGAQPLAETCFNVYTDIASTSLM